MFLIVYNGNNKYCNDMKDKIREILVKHSDNKNANDRIEAELLDLFNVSGCSLLKDDESWDDVISGFSLENNLTAEQESLLDDIIKYLDENYNDIFNNR